MNSKNRTEDAINESSAATPRDASACANWFGGICEDISAEKALHLTTIGEINRALLLDACLIGMAAMTRANPSMTAVRSSSASALSNVRRTLPRQRSVCSNRDTNVASSFKKRVHFAQMLRNATAARGHADG